MAGEPWVGGGRRGSIAGSCAILGATRCCAVSSSAGRRGIAGSRGFTGSRGALERFVVDPPHEHAAGAVRRTAGESDAAEAAHRGR